MVLVFHVFFFALAGLYFFLFIFWQKGLKSFYGFRRKANTDLPPVSVLIPSYRDADKLPQLLASFRLQKRFPLTWEIILVDDHNPEAEREKMRALVLNTPDLPIRMLSNRYAPGKKNALRSGVEAARFDNILQTDADVRLGIHWMESLSAALLEDGTQLAMGWVKMVPETSFWSRFAALEFLSLQATGLAMAANGKAIMGNGASMAYRKEIYWRYRSVGESLASGDDVFLIQSIARQEPAAVRPIPKAVVATAAPSTWAAFRKQRIRWGGKTQAYPSLSAKLLALFIGIFNASLALSPGLVILLPPLGLDLLLLWVLKGFLDYQLLGGFADWSKQKERMQDYPLVALLYPYYLCLIALGILAKSSPEWRKAGL